jgi:hypothetical protein
VAVEIQSTVPFVGARLFLARIAINSFLLFVIVKLPSFLLVSTGLRIVWNAISQVLAGVWPAPVPEQNNMPSRHKGATSAGTRARLAR